MFRFIIAVHGTRGDIEPAAAVARELQGRGHCVSIAVPPNLIEFTKAAGLRNVVAYGPDSQKQSESDVFRNWWKLRNPLKAIRQMREYATDGWAEMSRVLNALSADADLLLSGPTYQELAANVSESNDTPFAALHYFPVRPNNYVLPVRLPTSLITPIWTAAEWAHWQVIKPSYDEQRRTLGLPPSHIRAIRHMIGHDVLEIQAYDRVFFPGLDKEWGCCRPIVGGITLRLPTEKESSIASWIEGGRPPIYFGFGSTPIDNPSTMISIIADTCRTLGRRILLGSGPLASYAKDKVNSNEMMITGHLNFEDIFRRCEAAVHHGGAGTTAASLRAGIPTLALWSVADQPLWANQVQRLGVGISRRLSMMTRETLELDLVAVLAPDCKARAQNISKEMTPVHISIQATADLLEKKAARKPH